MVLQLPNVASMFWVIQLFPRHVENNKVASPTSGGRQNSILYRAVTRVQCEERFCYGSSGKPVITNIDVKLPTISSVRPWCGIVYVVQQVVSEILVEMVF